jgi:hypothetical protein
MLNAEGAEGWEPNLDLLRATAHLDLRGSHGGLRVSRSFARPRRLSELSRLVRLELWARLCRLRRARRERGERERPEQGEPAERSAGWDIK